MYYQFSRATLVAISILAATTCAWSQSKSGQSTSQSPVSFGAVRPGNIVLPQISIQIAGDQGVGRTIQKDLELADVASAPKNTEAVSAAAAADRQMQQGINFEAWTQATVSYVLRGIINGSTGQAELYDVAGRKRVFGKTYQNVGNASSLAHRIADDAIQAITGAPGIFSSRVAVLVGPASGKREVAIIDPDGGNLATLTSENAIVATPAWGRGGNEIFFTSYKDNNPDLYGVTLDRRRYAVSRRPGLNTSPSWTQAAQRLAVTLSKDGNTEIYTMGANGQNLARLTRNTAADTAPCYSPDGSQLVFTSDDTGLPEIYIMSANGSGRRKLTNQGYCDSATWSPDGKKIAYVKREEGGFNIYVMDLASGNTTRITNGGDNMEPTWAPNSLHLIFAGTRGGGRNLYLVNTQTKQAKQITTQGNFSSPSWGPLLR